MYNVRKNRGKTQRLYLLDCQFNNSSWTFRVQGLTNIYQLYISSDIMKCSCPDFQGRNRLCKHLYFIVSRIAQSDNLVDILEQIEKTSKPLCLNGVNFALLTQLLFKRLQERFNIKEKEIKEKKSKIKLDNVDCPICYEQIDSLKEEITQCKKQCKTYYHQECLLLWINSSKNCPMCRISIVRSEIDSKYQDTTDIDPFSKISANNITGVL